ncbi:hypothetical protein I7I48_07017 [Histoplasma ohiense]|nr:hypothetical protein I7I48_07017 [Histoplasma ohiense (nom. inval.)]
MYHMLERLKQPSTTCSDFAGTVSVCLGQLVWGPESQKLFASEQRRFLLAHLRHGLGQMAKLS